MTEDKPMPHFEVTADGIHILMGGPGVGRFIQSLIDTGADKIVITLLTPERMAELMQQAKDETKGAHPDGS